MRADEENNRSAVSQQLRQMVVVVVLIFSGVPAAAEQTVRLPSVSMDARGDFVLWVAQRSQTPEDLPEQIAPDADEVMPEVVETDSRLPPVTEKVLNGDIWQNGCSSYNECETGWGAFCWGRKCCSYPGICNGRCRHTRVYRAFYLGHLWFDAEALAWSTKSQKALSLVTTSPDGTASNDAGVLGLSSTTTLAGNETLFDSLQPGGRLTGGWWFDADQFSGIELQYFLIGGEQIDFRSNSPILARPYTDGSEASVLSSYEGIVEGEIQARVDMAFSGAGALYRRALSTGCHHRIDALCGYRYARLCDSLRVNEELTSLDAASGFDSGLDVSRFDHFRAENEFHGGELGLVGRWQRGCWSLELLGKTALGNSRQDVLIDGQTTTVDDSVDPSSTVEYAGGVLAQPANLGSYSKDELAYVTELGVSAQYDFSCQLRVSVGYSFIYWSDVSRVLDHVSPEIDPGEIPPATGGGTSTFDFITDNFWAQGLTAGIEYQF
ncbi:MAG: BBP7 family outer membrane beta-barrel protein [Planctomycetaceae bacterium]|nr:BBP7 family outer membrane beta-barrel protein [Planctomycetaceae bacterium]